MDQDKFNQAVTYWHDYMLSMYDDHGMTAVEAAKMADRAMSGGCSSPDVINSAAALFAITILQRRFQL